jgi:hypothetical protein
MTGRQRPSSFAPGPSSGSGGSSRLRGALLVLVGALAFAWGAYSLNAHDGVTVYGGGATRSRDSPRSYWRDIVLMVAGAGLAARGLGPLLSRRREGSD